jgi:hypothetical protein
MANFKHFRSHFVQPETQHWEPVRHTYAGTTCVLDLTIQIVRTASREDLVVVCDASWESECRVALTASTRFEMNLVLEVGLALLSSCGELTVQDIILRSITNP